MSKQLDILHARLAERQRSLILLAADTDLLPPANTLSQIASLEGALGAVDMLLDAAERGAASDGNPRQVESDAAQEARFEGTVKWFNAAKGYGFITPSGSGPDAFVHISAVEEAGLDFLREGQSVSYALRPDPRTGKDAASALRDLDGESD